jgi:hypothetical protein
MLVSVTSLKVSLSSFCESTARSKMKSKEVFKSISYEEWAAWSSK